MPEEITALETQEAAQAENENPAMEDSRTYSQEEFVAAVEEAVKERMAGAIRERVDRANKQKKELSSENKELAEQVKNLSAQLEELQTEKHLRELVKSISEETGVPANLLRGTTEDELREHAEELKGYISKPSAPYIGSDGFAADGKEQKQSARDKFAETIDDLFSR